MHHAHLNNERVLDMFYKPEICREAWAEEKRNSPIGDTYADIEAWGKFWDYISSTYKGPNDHEYVLKIVDFLRADGAFNENASVLDIGCGPGTYTLPFLKAGAKQVDCVDISEGMLSELKESAESEGLQNRVGIFPCTWGDYQSEKKYNLVFSSMSPAISEYDELLRMEEFSAGKCCLVTYGNSGSQYQIQSRLWEALRGSRINSEVFNAIYPFNVLYSMGRHPNMKTFCKRSTSRMTLEKAYEHYLVYFEIFGYTSETDKRIIRENLDEVAQDGFCSEDTVSCVSVIWWSVHD